MTRGPPGQSQGAEPRKNLRKGGNGRKDVAGCMVARNSKTQLETTAARVTPEPPANDHEDRNGDVPVQELRSGPAGPALRTEPALSAQASPSVRAKRVRGGAHAPAPCRIDLGEAEIQEPGIGSVPGMSGGSRKRGSTSAGSNEPDRSAPAVGLAPHRLPKTTAVVGGSGGGPRLEVLLFDAKLDWNEPQERWVGPFLSDPRPSEEQGVKGDERQRRNLPGLGARRRRPRAAAWTLRPG
jgi:hypothetical protein